MIKRMTAGAALLGCLLASASYGQADVEKIKAALRAGFPDVQIEAIQPAKFGGWYEVVTPTELVYTNADGSLLFAGRVLDVKSKQDLTAARFSEINSVDFSGLPLDLAVKTVRGDGSRKLVVFSDPDCPFCQQLEKQMQGMTNVTTYTFLFPLESIHPGATAKAQQIWCAEDRDAAWNAWMQTRALPPARECKDHPTAAIQALARKLKVRSTPTLVFANGRRIDGLVPNEQLEKEFTAAATGPAARTR